MNGQIDNYTPERHVRHLASAYVLELLKEKEKQQVANHISHCQECRSAVRDERQIAYLVRDTLTVTTRISAPELRRLRPGSPTRPAPIFGRAWQFRLALVGLLAMIILGGISLQYDAYQLKLTPEIATAYLTSTVITDTPRTTSTMARSVGNSIPLQFVTNPTPVAIAIPSPAIAPVPAAPLLH